MLSLVMPNKLDFFYSYICETGDLNGIMSEKKDWVTLENLFNEEQISLDVITNNGLLIPKRSVYIRLLNPGKIVVVINKKMIKKFNADPNNIFMSMNVDSDVVNDISMISHIPGIVNNFATISAAFAGAGDYSKVKLFVNGFNLAIEYFSTIKITDVVEYYNDQNISFVQSVSLENRSSYWSQGELLLKDIIHINKTNSAGKLRTYDTIELFIRGDNGLGIMLPFNYMYSVSQLTNGDLGITTSLIDYAINFLNSDNCSLFLIYKGYSKDDKLIPNGYFGEKLNQFESDVNIIAHIDSTIDPNLTIWSGNRLETQKYNLFMFNAPTEDFSLNAIKDHISCLGFHNYLATIDPEVIYKSTTSITQYLDFYKPKALNDIDMYPIVYQNGLKINGSTILNVEQIESTLGNSVRMNFSEEITVAYPTAKLIEYPHFFSYRKIPTETYETLIIPNTDDIKIFIKMTGVTIKTVNSVLNSGYKEVDPGNTSYLTLNTDSNNHTIVFNFSAVGKEFVIHYKHHSSVKYTILDISTGATISIIPNTKTIDGLITIPILTNDNYEIYLNKKLLAPNVDYINKKLTADEDATIFAGYQLIIQNLKFLYGDQDNILEVISTGCVSEQTAVGFVINNTIFGTTENDLFVNRFDHSNSNAYNYSISRLFVNGKLVKLSNITRERNQYVISPGVVNNGEVYVITTDINARVKDALVVHQDANYNNDRIAVNDYFLSDYEPITPSPLVVPYTHTLYSSYLNEIIRRIIDGTIAVDYVPTDVGILAQLENYNYLKDFDILFDANNKVDSRFVDFYPGYIATVSINDMEKYQFIKRFVNIMLRNDLVHDGNIVFQA